MDVYMLHKCDENGERLPLPAKTVQCDGETVYRDIVPGLALCFDSDTLLTTGVYVGRLEAED